jgi:CubicO group peptidase (beta-lactamase class C family)
MWRREPEIDPEEVGMDAGLIDRMADEFAQTCEAGQRFHGAQMAVYRDGRRVLDVGGGLARVRTGDAVEEDTLFVIFSCTKALASLAMLMLYERGLFHFDEPVVRYWPEFARVVPEKASVTIRHVLSHRAGFPGGPDWLAAEHWGDRSMLCRAMEEVELSFPPGSRNAYHALNFGHVVDELIRRVDGRSCGAFLTEEVFSPLGLADIHLGLPEDEGAEGRVAWCYNEMDLGRARATGVVAPGQGTQSDRELEAVGLREEVDPELEAVGLREEVDPEVEVVGLREEVDPELEAVGLREEVDPEVEVVGLREEVDPEFPERAHPFNRPSTWRAGLPAAGGIATARDLTAVLAVLACGGRWGGVELVRPESIAAATAPTNREGDLDGTVGWPLRWSTGFSLGFHGDGSTLRTFGHGGAGGQETFADPDRRLAWTFLTNGELSEDFIDWRYALQSMAFAACRD